MTAKLLCGAVSLCIALGLSRTVAAQVPSDEKKNGAARAEDTVSLTAGLSWFQYFGGSYGATLGFYVLEDTLIEVDGYRAGSLAPGQTSETVALRLQQFFSQAAYVRGGIRLRHLETFDTLDFEELEKQIVQTDLGLDVAIGARYQKGRFVAGMDFVAIYIPVNALDTKRQIFDDQNDELLDEAPTGDVRRPDVRLASGYLGASF